MKTTISATIARQNELLVACSMPLVIAAIIVFQHLQAIVQF